MQIVSIHDICYKDIDVCDIEVFPESWAKRKEFSLYQHTPRPKDAFFFICSDILASFYSENQLVLQAKQGDIVYIPQGICYKVSVSGNESRINTYTVNFTLRSTQKISLSPQITLLAGCFDKRFELLAKELSEAIYPLSGDGTQQNICKIKSVFFSLLDAVAGAAMAQKDIYYPIRLGVHALREQWNQNRKVEEYAALCGISPAYFYKCFKEWSGKSPIEYRNLLRFNNAATMLCHTDMPITEISEIVGFEDAFYFSRVFTRHFRLSPQKYRKQFRKI